MKYEAFGESLVTKQGFTAGLCGIKKKHHKICLNTIKERLVECRISKEDDIYDIDYKLSHVISKNIDDSIVAIGANIKIPWINEATGGVIGSPKKHAQSSKGDIEALEEDLFLFSFPGKLGIVLEGSKEALESIVKDMDFNHSAMDDLIAPLITKLSYSSNKVAVIITDGSGEASKGFIILKNQNKINKIVLEEKGGLNGQN